jgi:hypothetical protein
MAPKKRKSTAQEDEEQPALKQSKLEEHISVETNEEDRPKEQDPPATADSDGEAVKHEASQAVQEAEASLDDDDSVLSNGTIFFLFKPKVNTPHPKSINDAARLHIILKPHDGPASLIIVGEQLNAFGVRRSHSRDTRS